MLSDSPTNLVPTLLAKMAEDDQDAAQHLFAILYEDLHRLAASYMQNERQDHTLQPTALIHEAFLRLVGPESQLDAYENVGHFIATAATVMRHILINHAKSKRSQKRSSGMARLQIDDISETFNARAWDLLALDEALERLQSQDALQYRLVELRFFGGMSVEQCAYLLNMSTRSVYYEWSHARAWLRDQLQD